ncbi:MAG: tetratricopeptide repeat protein [Anaerolineales bacterium]|nr:MAG: tetratricopeptide repeat protein [Anaerolineales bacterium]
MATTNLRDYLQGIEQFIDSAQVEDALAHCRHVLKTFPKNIDTYRLMGKAYLESKRHSEASDLFQRVLSSIPDDFVAHIGMSIIREDEGHLDAAIWHMERAFESQPSNKAVQGEVRRLYGMREGYEPPKVRLTRGALARMYSHGDLYNQAISELRNALAEDAQRPDLQVLLAEMHFKNNQPAEATEVCHQIIQKLPYCLYANRVMVDILRNAQQDVEANPYWERVEELDPYAAQVSTLKDVSLVPPESVTLEALELDSPMLLGAPAATDQDAPDFEKEDLPDWLSVENLETSGEPDAEADSSVLSSLEGLEPVAPAAGGAFMDDVSEDMPTGDEQSPFKTGALQPDEIPDWLRELRPGSSAPGATAALPDEPPGKRWTEEFAEAGFSPTGPLNLDPPLEDPTDAAEPSAQAPIDPAHDDSPQPSRPTGWLPTGELSWLDSAFTDGEEAPAANEDDEEPAASAETAAESPTPTWLAELDQADLEHTQPTRPVAAFTDAPELIDPAPPADEPEAAEPELPQVTAEPAKRPTEPVVNWLGELQASSGMADDLEQEADEEDALSADADSTQRFDALGWDAPAADSEAEQLEAAAEQPATASPSQEEQETLNWLEGLAARRGAAEDELLTEPEERRTSKPEWLDAQPNEEDGPTAAAEASAPLSDNLSWLDELAAASGSVAAATQDLPETAPEAQEAHGLEEDSPFSQPDPEMPAEETQESTPGWLRQFTGSLQNADDANEPIAPRPLDDAPDWLSELRPQDDAPATQPLTAPEATPHEDIPDWLSQLSKEQDQAASQTPAATQPSHSQDVPDWLQQLSQQETAGGTGSLPTTPPSSAPAEPAEAEPASEEGDLRPEETEEEPTPAPAIEPTWVPASQLSEPASPIESAEEPGYAEEQEEEVEYETITFSGSLEAQPEPEARQDEQAEVGEAEYVSLAEDEPAGDEDAYSEHSLDDEEAEPATPDEVELPSSAQAEPELQPEPAPQRQPEPMAQAAHAETSAPPAEAKPARKRSRGLSPEEIEDRLAGARQALSYGNINDAAEAYSYFLRRRIRLDDVIADLRAASRRFPRQVAVWQTLGDAYMRNNELTEALDCYSRAKALL